MNLPFDPAETGPWDLYAAGKAWVREHALYVVPALAAALAVVVWLRPGATFAVTDVPPWVRVFIVTAAVVGALAYIPAQNFIDFLYTRDRVTLVELAPVEGDIKVHRLSPDRFADITVFDENGERQGRNYLARLTTPNGLAYECKQYEPEANAALSSWLADRSYKDVRASEKTLERIETDMAKEADKFLDLRVNHGSIIRKVYRRVINRQITQTEKMTVPDGELISETIDEVLDDMPEPAKRGTEAEEHAIAEETPDAWPFGPDGPDDADRRENGHTPRERAENGAEAPVDGGVTDE